MADDILPPLPPGEERRAAAKEEKKGGFLGKLFGKKKEKPAEPTPVFQPLTPLKSSPDVSPDINLDAIRKELGLNPAFGGVEEPAKITQPAKAKEKPKVFGLENGVLSLPDIEMPPEYEAGNEKLAFEDENLVDMPPKIVEQDLTKKEDKKAKWWQKQGELKPKQAVDNLSWTSNIEKGQGQTGNAEFLKDTIPELELKKPANAPEFIADAIPKQTEPPAKSGFVQDVSPKEVKRLAREMKRKQFEEKKGISYEPEVNIDDKPEPADETLLEERDDETLFDDSPEQEIENLKAKLFAEISVKEPKEEPPKAPLPPEKDAKKPMKIKLIENELKVPQPPQATEASKQKLAAPDEEKPEEPNPAGEPELPELLKSDEFDIEEPPKISIDDLGLAEEKPAETKSPSELKKDAKKEAKEAKEEAKDAMKEKGKEAKLLKDVEKELKTKVSSELADKIRIEERAKAEMELESRRQEIVIQKQELEKQKQSSEAAIEKKRQELEKSRQAVEQDKIMLAGKINQYDFKEKQLKKENAELEKDRDNFKKETGEAKELIKKLPTMRTEYDSLQSKMKSIYDKLKEYEHKESDLLKLERSIDEKQKLLAKEQSLLEETEEQIHEKGFSGYLENEVSKEPIVSKVFESKDIMREPHLEVYSMIDQCKVMIREKNIPDAKRIYMQIRDVYSSIKTAGPDKDLIYTAVRELYDDIKLAEMDSSTEM